MLWLSAWRDDDIQYLLSIDTGSIFSIDDISMWESSDCVWLWLTIVCGYLASQY